MMTTELSALGQSLPGMHHADRQLIASMMQLAWRKGFNDQSLPDVCQALRLKSVGNCVMHQIGYPRDDSESVIKDGAGHAFNFYREPGTKLLRIVIFGANRQYGEFYLVGLDGSLVRAVKKEGLVPDATWSPISIEEALPGFRQELNYWRVQIPVLDKEPNRKN